MKRCAKLRLSLSAAIGLVVLSAAAKSTMAQDVIAAAAPAGHAGHHHLWGSHPGQAVFPRTFSYQYDSWFNRPQHTRHVAPDGKVFWRTTVRGLPLGTPWPSYRTRAE